MKKTFYAKGGATGSGSSADDPLGIELPEKWQLIQFAAQSEPVVIRLVKGVHTQPINIADRSFANRVTIVSDQPDAARLHRMIIVRSSNLEINGLTWVNAYPIEYRTALAIGDYSHDVDVVNCIFRNLRYIKRSGSHAQESAHHIRYLGCTFENIGIDGGSHLMYHSNNAHHITLSKCIFKDCPGDYVRFRNNVHHCMVRDCIFENTGIYLDPDSKKSFIQAYVNNDKEPGTEEYPEDEVPDDQRHRQYEMFGTDFIVSNSRFIGDGVPFKFVHKGWGFPGHNYLMNLNEKETLENGSLSERQTLLKNKYDIRVERIMMVNVVAERDDLCIFLTAPANSSGAVGAGVDITDLINHGAHRGKVNEITLNEIGCYVELDSTGGIQWVIQKATHPNYDAIVRVLHDTAVRREKVLLRLRRKIGRTNEILYINRKYII